MSIFMTNIVTRDLIEIKIDMTNNLKGNVISEK